MSYDLMVFEPEAAPQGRVAFLEWYQAQTQWSEDHSYNDPSVTTHKLRKWFIEMIWTFPAMNGPYRSEEHDDPRVSDYCIGREVIYVAFAWSQAENAYRTMYETAKAFGVGFFDVSAENGQVWLPGADDEYVCVHGG